MNDYMNYKDKICVVTGAASGMGKACAELLVEQGAKVYALDINDVEVEGIEASIPVDLSDKASIDDAFTKLPDKIDKFFGVAGLRGATLPFIQVAKINLVANKYMLEEKLIDRFNEGGAIAIVTSAVGVDWQIEGNKKYYEDVINATSWDATVDAIEATGFTASNGGFAYVYTKQAMNYLIAKMQQVYAKKHIRINALMPGDTDTNFGKEDGQGVNKENPSAYAGYSDRVADPKEMAMPLLFLNSDMASYVSGTYIFADYGTSCEIMAGLRDNPVGESTESNIMKSMNR